MSESGYSEGGEIHMFPKLPYAHIFYDPTKATVQQRFRHFTEQFKDREALGFRELNPDGKFGNYVFINNAKFGELVTHFGSGLLELGLVCGDRIGTFSKNCIEWSITDFSTGVFGLINVPVYDAYRPEDCKYIIEHSGMKAIIVSYDLLPFINDLKKDGGLPDLQHVIFIDNQQSAGKATHGSTHLFSEIIKLGSEHVHPDEPSLTPESIFTIVYTSGTTGTPKGAILLHRNFCTGAVALLSRGISKEFFYEGADLAAPNAPITQPDVSTAYPMPEWTDADIGVNTNADPKLLFRGGRLFSYLPLAHIFERTLEFLFLDIGLTVGYYSGNISNLTSDIAALGTTDLPGVPRVFNKTYDKINAGLANSFFAKRWLFSMAYNSKKKLPTMVERVYKKTWADNIVFKGIRATFGSHVLRTYTGSAPLSGKVMEFLSIVLGVSVCEGYGTTETCCCVTCTSTCELDVGCQGLPHVFAHVRLESIPAMDYLTTDRPNPRGEILIRGPMVFKGYYKDEEQTKEIFTEDGFLRTGDVGEWVDGAYPPAKSLKVIDRRKNIFKMSQGEFICAERIETLYTLGDKYLLNLMVMPASPQVPASSAAAAGSTPSVSLAQVASSTQSVLLGLVVPNWAALLDEANAAETGAASWEGVREYWAKGGTAAAAASPPEKPVDESPVPLELRQKLASLSSVRDFYFNYLSHKQKASSGALKPYEVVQGVVVSPEEWVAANGLSTPSFKIKRELIKRRFAANIVAEVARVAKK